MDPQNCELNDSTVVELPKVTKNLESANKDENNITCSKTDVTTVETKLNSSCDNNFPKTSEVNDTSRFEDCDKIDNNIFPPAQQEVLNISVLKSEIQNQVVNTSGTINKISDTSQDLLINTIIKTDDCTSPVKKQSKTVQSTDASLREVVDKVNKLDIVGKHEAKSNISAVILKNQTSSLKSLCLYHSESSDNETEDFEANWQLHVFPSSSSSSDSESDSQESVETSEDEDNSGFVLPNKDYSTKKVEKIIFEPMDPPMDLSNLQIDYANETFLHIGHITNFIDTTVTIDTVANTDSYDLETILFINDEVTKRPLGAICDVIGPVHQPVYCVRLHDVKEIETLGLKEGTKVYSAPKIAYTKYVFLKDLLRMKGTDASWTGDEEPPSDIDTSEEEMDTGEHTSRKRTHNNSLERHKQFEKSKNRCNIIKSQVANLFDKYKTRPKAQNIHMFPHGFNPNVPPPNIQNSVGVAPLPAPRQPIFTHVRPNRRLPDSSQVRGPGFFTNNVGYGYHQNAPGPSYQNHY